VVNFGGHGSHQSISEKPFSDVGLPWQWRFYAQTHIQAAVGTGRLRFTCDGQLSEDVASSAACWCWAPAERSLIVDRSCTAYAGDEQVACRGLIRTACRVAASSMAASGPRMRMV
jgi:hypothetical protein